MPQKNNQTKPGQSDGIIQTTLFCDTCLRSLHDRLEEYPSVTLHSIGMYTFVYIYINIQCIQFNSKFYSEPPSAQFSLLYELLFIPPFSLHILASLTVLKPLSTFCTVPYYFPRDIIPDLSLHYREIGLTQFPS